MGALLPAGALGNSVSPPRRWVRLRPRVYGHAPTTVDSLRVLACARSGAAAPGRVMPGQPQVASVLRVLLCDRGQAGAGLIEPGLAALGQGLAALPQRQGVLQGDGARLKTLHDGHQLLTGPLIAERGDVLIGTGRPACGRGRGR